MRNDNKNWTAPDLGDKTMSVGGVTIQRVLLPCQTLVSGVSVLNHYKELLGPAVGWPDVAQGSSYAIVLRRDQVLLINGPVLEDGWDGTTEQAISDMTSGQAVFEMSGAAVFEVLKRGVDVNFDIPSRSALRRIGDLNVILYRFQNEKRVRLHVGTAYQEALRLTLQTYLNKLE